MRYTQEKWKDEGPSIFFVGHYKKNIFILPTLFIQKLAYFL